MDWEQFEGRTVSVLITGKGEKKESFIGTVEVTEGDFLIINPNNPNFGLEMFYIRKDIIESIWLYKRKKEKE
uniref:Uncharacterized protein n=1 Tax=viral metagenome TaxID=1070528 RepID=A0A6H1ZGI5_9ZZZZ